MVAFPSLPPWGGVAGAGPITEVSGIGQGATVVLETQQEWHL